MARTKGELHAHCILLNPLILPDFLTGLPRKNSINLYKKVKKTLRNFYKYENLERDEGNALDFTADVDPTVGILTGKHSILINSSDVQPATVTALVNSGAFASHFHATRVAYDANYVGGRKADNIQ